MYCVVDSVMKDPEYAKVIFEKQKGDTIYMLLTFTPSLNLAVIVMARRRLNCFLCVGMFQKEEPFGKINTLALAQKQLQT